MAISGIMAGGFAQGFQGEQKINNEAAYQQGLLQVQQQELQNQQQRDQNANFMKIRSDAVSHLDDTINALKVAHPDWGPLQIASNPAITAMKQQIGTLDQNLKLPNTIDSIVASLAEKPSAASTAHSMAVATGAYGKDQAQTAEAQARTRVLDQASGYGQGNKTNPDLDTDTQLGGKQFKSSGNPRVDNIIKGVDNGDLPPVVSGNVSYKDRTAFASGVEANGINLAQKQLQWKQAEKQIQSLNGPQMTRYVGLNTSVQNTIGEVLALSQKMKLSGIPALNSAELAGYINTEGNSPNGQLATAYQTSVGVLKEEFANLANGGYAPTDPAWKLADQQINGNYGWQQLPASLGEVKKLINIRLHAIPGMDTLGPGATNQYTGKSGAAKAPAYKFNSDTGELEPQ